MVNNTQSQSPDSSGLSNPYQTPYHETISVSVISNSRLFREGIVALLDNYLYLRKIGGYSGRPDFHHDLPNPEGHVVLLDSGIGPQNSELWTRWWRSLTPPAFVVVLELANDPQIILDCIEAGANAYAVRDTSPAEVAQTIWMVRQGKVRCSPEIAGQMASRLAQLGNERDQAASDSPLTNRELEVLHCIARGSTNQQIAEELMIELSTVKHHVHNILSKLELKHRWAAVDHARRFGWLDSSM